MQCMHCMQSTSVRLDAAVKRRLDHLQGLAQAELGQRLSHSELLRRLLRYAERDVDRFLSDAPARTWDRKQWDEWAASLPPTEVTDASNLDRDLYRTPHRAKQSDD
jgi:hypothetical protein